MTIATSTSFGLVKFLNHHEVCLFMFGYHHLCYALAWLNGEGLVGEVNQYHAYLATIVGINGARGVKHSNAVLQSQSATWAPCIMMSAFLWGYYCK